MSPSAFPIVAVREICNTRDGRDSLPQNIELFSLHLDPGVQGNAREVAFGVGNVAYKSSSYGWDGRNMRMPALRTPISANCRHRPRSRRPLTLGRARHRRRFDLTGT